VSDDDIQTVDLSVQPVFDDHHHITGYGRPTPSPPGSST
jgi:hypothetical protein